MNIDYKLVVENLNEGVWVIDKDGGTTYVSPKMAEILGYAPEEMLGKNLLEFMDEEHKEVCKNNMRRRSEGISEEHEFTFLKKDGEELHALLVTSPMTDNNGNYIGAIAGVMDITERKKAEENLKKKIHDLEVFQKATVDRELKMVELKKKVAELEKELSDR